MLKTKQAKSIRQLKLNEKLKSTTISPRAMIKPRDLALWVELTNLLFILWLIPKRSRLSISSGPASVRQPLCRVVVARKEHVFKGRSMGMRPVETARTKDAHWFLDRLRLLRMHRPAGWTPTIGLEIRERAR
jgi:hypothetical protein